MVYSSFQFKEKLLLFCQMHFEHKEALIRNCIAEIYGELTKHEGIKIYSSIEE